MSDADVKGKLKETADTLDKIKGDVSCEENRTKVGAASELLKDVVKEYDQVEATNLGAP